MVPTDTELTGLHGGMSAGVLLLPMEGEVYRYILENDRPERITADYLLYAFSEGDEGRNWEVYSLQEYPDKQKVLLISNTGIVWLCAYDPPFRCSDTALADAIAEGCVVLEDNIATHGQDIWHEFVELTQQGKVAEVKVVHFFNFHEEHQSWEMAEIYRQDYPMMGEYHLSYDGDTFILNNGERITTWRYLLQDQAPVYSYVSSREPEWNDVYALTNRANVTWEQLWKSLTISAKDAAIEHFTIYTERQE
jgi:hypothetical protein